MPTILDLIPLEFFERTAPWLYDHGVKIVLIFVGAYIILRFFKILIEKIVRRVIRAGRRLSKREGKQREDTLVRVFSVAIDIVIWVLATLMIFQEAGVAIGPLLAAAGIAGVALGFGGQYVIRDLLTGLFIIMENQYRIGDVVCLNTTCGLVEDISIRMTTLRDLDGVVYHVPHGEIKLVSNMSKNFARVNLNLNISYDEDLERVVNVVNKVGDELARDKDWEESIIKVPQFLRIEEFGQSAIVIKVLGETKPLKQWDVTGELRKRIKIAFDREGIEFPYPHQVIRSAPPRVNNRNNH